VEVIELNQSNFDIGEVLKASLEKELPSVSFENIWSKYSEHKKPHITLKRMAILVAAILIIVVSKKYISSINKLSGTKNIVSNIEVKNSASDFGTAKKSMLKADQIAPKTNAGAAKANEPTASAKKPEQSIMFSKAVEPLESIVIWKNKTYNKTMITVSLKELGKKLGNAKKKTEKSRTIWEENTSPLEADLYSIKGENPQKVIAIKIEGIYYRANRSEIKK
jgi:hypothetical protein